MTLVQKITTTIMSLCVIGAGVWDGVSQGTFPS